MIAGAAAMPYPLFLSANVLGALVWGAGLTVLGYWSASLPGLRDATIAVGITVATLTTAAAVARWVRHRRTVRTAEAGETPPTEPRAPSEGQG